MDWRVYQKRRLAVVVLAILIRPVNVQFAMPMYQPPSPSMFGMPPPPQPQPPMFAMPPHMAFMQVQIPNHQKRPMPAPTPPKMPNNNNNVAVAIPVPMPMPLQVAIPAQTQPSFCSAKPRPPSCPPCPPCICYPTCTPSFYAYCSSCHQKCRCRDVKDAPVPLPPAAPIPVSGPAFPYPMPMPPSAIIVPVPPDIRKPHRDSSSRSSERKPHCSDRSSGSSDESSGSSSSEYEKYRKRAKRIRSRFNKRLGKHRYPKNHRGLSRSELQFSRRSMDDRDDVIKPVLSFVNNNGNIKLKTKLTEEDVNTLMHDSAEPETIIYNPNNNMNQHVQHVKVWTDQDESKHSQLTVMTEDDEKDLNNEDFRRSNRQVILRKMGSEVVKPGRKELVFKAPQDKTISNLSLSFQVA